MQPIRPTSIRAAEAGSVLGVHVATVWGWAKSKPDFPKPRKLSPRCTVFDLGELIAWRDKQVSGEGDEVRQARREMGRTSARRRALSKEARA